MNVLNAYTLPLFNVTYKNPWEAIYQHESARVERFLGRHLDSPELVADFADAELRRMCEMSGEREQWDVAVSSRRTVGELDLMRWNDAVIAEQITALEVLLRTRAERIGKRWGAVESTELASELLSPVPSLLNNERERDALAQLWSLETDVAIIETEDQATVCSTCGCGPCACDDAPIERCFTCGRELKLEDGEICYCKACEPVFETREQVTGLKLSDIRARFLTDLRAPEVFGTSPHFAGEQYFSGSESGEFSPRA